MNRTFKMSALTISMAMIATGAMAKGNWEKEFKDADLDNNGSLSMAEWSAQSEDMFQKIDANDDGNISMDEKKEFVMKHKEKYDKDHDKDRM